MNQGNLKKINEYPWVEKYRPRQIEEIILDKTILLKFKTIIATGCLPQLFITGPPGCGKTTSAICLAKKLVGKNYTENMIELNASDNRGLDIIHDKILGFCQKKILTDTVGYKIIILDEADNLTIKTQNILSDIMDQYKETTRFIFTCNDSSQILEAIQSRCLIIHMKRITVNDMSNRLMYICKNENINYETNGINEISKISQGDIRQGINNLEIIHNSFDLITSHNVYEICDLPNPFVIKQLLLDCTKGIDQLNNVLEHILQIKKKGYCSNDILITMINVLYTIDINEKLRILFFDIINETCITINDGIDTMLQLNACLSQLCLTSSSNYF